MRRWLLALIMVPWIAVGQVSCPEATELMERVWGYYRGVESLFAVALVEIEGTITYAAEAGTEPPRVESFTFKDTIRQTMWYAHPWVRVDYAVQERSGSIAKDEVTRLQPDRALYDLAGGRLFHRFADGTWEWSPLDLFHQPGEDIAGLFGLVPNYTYTARAEGELDGRPVWVVQAEGEEETTMFRFVVEVKASATFWIDPKTLRVLRSTQSAVSTSRGSLPEEAGLETITFTFTNTTTTVWEEFLPGVVFPAELFAIPEGAPLRGAMGAVEPYPAPDFRAQDLAGNELALSDLSGKVVVLYFWDGELDAVYDDLMSLRALSDMAGPEVAIVAVAVGEDDRPFPAELITEGLRKLRATFPVIPDPERRIAALYEVETLPAMFILDREGLVRCRDPGATNVMMWVMALSRKRG